MKRKILIFASLLSIITFSACTTQAVPAAVEVQAQQEPLIPTITMTASPQPTFTNTSPAPTDTLIPLPRVCSPMEGLSIEQLSAQISNPYLPPSAGSDNPHQGVDLADLMPGSQVALSGRPVQAVMAGRVAMVIKDRFPYGSAILIETPLSQHDLVWWDGAQIPTPAPTLAGAPALTCPAGMELTIPDANQRSLYLLYAHLQEPPTLAPGDAVGCGQAVGIVGSSGNAMNPHLHLEALAGTGRNNSVRATAQND